MPRLRTLALPAAFVVAAILLSLAPGGPSAPALAAPATPATPDGGDMMPYMFRQQKIGPLVGIRTWGGLVGIWDYPALIDGGVITVPRGGFFNLDGEWDVENKGTPPDVEVEITPKDVAAGRDPQLERAVAEALQRLEKNPVRLLREPAPPVRVPR